MIPREFFYLIFFLCGGGLVLASVLLGFRLGRRSLNIVEVKPGNPGPNDLEEEDPYREAMNDGVERIPTVDKQ